MADFGSFVLGLISGLTPTLIWQMWLEPWRDRMNAAKVLRTEVQLNLRHLIAQREWLEARCAILEDFRTSHVVFDALAGTVAEFPDRLVEAIIRAYEHLEHLVIVSERVRAYKQRLDQLEDDVAEDSPKRRKLSIDIQAGVDAFRDSLDGAIKTLEHARRCLHDTLPYWSKEQLTPLKDIERDSAERVSRSINQKRQLP